MSLIMCVMTLALVGCENKLEIENNDSNSNGIDTEVVSGSINGHEYVDLGLPSGTKWATCNVGADNPEEYGNYYAWGETETKEKYTISKYGGDNCLTCSMDNIPDISGNSEYDVASKNWGESWRMPTKKEMTELKNECTWIYEKRNGVDGYKVIGPNNKSIFLPNTGYILYDLDYDYTIEERNGSYWTSTPNKFFNMSYYMDFKVGGDGNPAVIEDSRACGRTVRPVSGDVNIENEIISYPSYLDGLWWEGHYGVHKLLLKPDMSYIEVGPHDVSQEILEGKYSIEGNNIILHRTNTPDLKGVILPDDSRIYIDFDKYAWMIEGSDEDKEKLESELKTKIQQQTMNKTESTVVFNSKKDVFKYCERNHFTNSNGITIQISENGITFTGRIMGNNIYDRISTFSPFYSSEIKVDIYSKSVAFLKFRDFENEGWEAVLNSQDGTIEFGWAGMHDFPFRDYVPNFDKFYLE